MSEERRVAAKDGSTPAATERVEVVRNTVVPDWGLGVIVDRSGTNWTVFFEHAGRKVFKQDAKALERVDLPGAELEALRHRVHGRHAHPAKSAAASKRPARAKAKPSKSAAVFSSFDEQVALFEKLFPGGFAGEKFIAQERGVAGAKGRAAYKEGAIAAARDQLSREHFQSEPVEALFAAARNVLGLTTIPFPNEGSIPFGQIAEAARPATVRALEQLLHGDGPYPERLERFAAAVDMKDAAGKPRKVTWPLASLFGGLYFPAEQTCVKPTTFAAQAATFGIDVKRSQPVNAAGYRKFLEVAQEAQRRLVALGHQPRDLIDVYSFIYRTHDAKPKAAAQPS